MLCIIVFGLFIVLYYRFYTARSLRNNAVAPNYGMMLLSMFLIIFESVNPNSDWYHYQDMVWNYDLSEGAVNHGEPIYRYIIGITNKNYFLFRLIVWGSAFMLSRLAFRRFGVNVNVATFFLIAVYLMRFNYARASLAMACYFCGLSYLLNPIKKIGHTNWLLVGAFFWGAYEFHHSLLPVLLFTLTAYLPIDKPMVIIPLLIFTPLLASFVFSSLDVFGYFGDMLGEAGGEDVYSKFNRYMEKETEETNIFGKVQNGIMYGTFVIPLVVGSFVVFKNKEEVSTIMTRLLRITIAITLFAIMFLFLDLLNTVFTYRYLFMTFIPLTILSVYLYQNRLMGKRAFSWIILWGIGVNVYGLLYGLYKVL